MVLRAAPPFSRRGAEEEEEEEEEEEGPEAERARRICANFCASCCRERGTSSLFKSSRCLGR